MVMTSGPRRKKNRKKDDRITIRTDGLVKVFGDLRAVDGLDLRIKKGQLYGLLGPNGSGKTTTIKMIMGLLKISEGHVEILGVKVPDRSILPSISYMPQETAIYREISVHDNIKLFCELYEVPPEQIAKREKEVLDLVNLWDWRNKVADKLSGGMRHRLSLACCLVHDPEVMFLDEPTVGVDPELRDSLWGYFKDLAAQGKTIIITTHYIEEARHCDLVGLMRKGKIIAEDAPRNLMLRAGNTETLEEAFLHFTRRIERTKTFGKRRKAARSTRRGEEE